MSNYFLLNFFTLLFPFLLSFHKRIRFYKNWKALFLAICVTGIFFITWDIIFTYKAVWGFNGEQVSGIYFAYLPIEEILFFFVVPYSSVFTYETIKILNFSELPEKVHRSISILLIIVLLVLLVSFYSQLYTFYVCLLTTSLLILLEFILHVTWMKWFYIVFGILLVPFLIMNGLLTSAIMGSVVVWYNNNQIIGLRLYSIPLEDVFYGMSLILMNIAVYEFFKSKKSPIIRSSYKSE